MKHSKLVLVAVVLGVLGRGRDGIAGRFPSRRGDRRLLRGSSEGKGA